MSENKIGDNYKNVGVDTDAADEWVARLASLTARAPAEIKNKLRSGVGDYAAVFEHSNSQWLATSCDGVGTKILWAEQGLGSAKDLAQDLVAMNANDLLCVGARPTLFLDYLAIGSKDLLKPGALVAEFIAGLIEVCNSSGQMVIGGETAQMPDLYEPTGFDVAGFSIGFLKPEEFLSVENITEGSEVWGWPSSGPHSNGFSWLRKIFDSKKDAAFIRENLMKPTRLYVNDFLDLRSELSLLDTSFKKPIQAAFHITGSGLLNFLRAQPKNRKIGFDLKNWPKMPGWVEEIRSRTGAAPADLYKAFNMGIGFSIVLAPDVAQRARPLLNSKQLVHLGSVISEPVVRVGGLELS